MFHVCHSYIWILEHCFQSWEHCTRSPKVLLPETLIRLHSVPCDQDVHVECTWSDPGWTDNAFESCPLAYGVNLPKKEIVPASDLWHYAIWWIELNRQIADRRQYTDAMILRPFDNYSGRPRRFLFGWPASWRCVRHFQILSLSWTQIDQPVS